MTDDIMLMGKNPNFLGSWDLYDAPGKAITVTIRSIESETVTNAGKTDMVTVCHFVEPVKPMILNLTNRKTLTKLYETKSSSRLVGKRITIGFEKVKAFGSIHDALRIRSVIPKGNAEPAAEEAQILCQDCGNPITAAYGRTPAQLADHTRSKFGRALCCDCAVAASTIGKQQEEKDITNQEEEDAAGVAEIQGGESEE